MPVGNHGETEWMPPKKMSAERLARFAPMAGMTSRAMLAQNATTLTQKQTHNTSTPNPAAGAPKCNGPMRTPVSYQTQTRPKRSISARPLLAWDTVACRRHVPG